MAKKILQLTFDIDFILVGIVCHAKDYRLCFEINRELEIDLERIDDLEIISGKNKSGRFALFRYDDEEQLKTYYIVSNKNATGMLLIPEQKTTDFFMLLKGSFGPAEKKEILDRLKKIALVLSAFEVDASKLKSKENLFF